MMRSKIGDVEQPVVTGKLSIDVTWVPGILNDSTFSYILYALAISRIEIKYIFINPNALAISRIIIRVHFHKS